MELKRDVIKYIRDKAKAKYVKLSACYICGSSENLELHHFNTLTYLLEVWLKKNPQNLRSNVVEWREDFIEEHQAELYDEVITLCSHHHNVKLHGIYGKTPLLHTAKKQARWCLKQREKHLNA